MKIRPIAYRTVTAIIAGETLAGGITDLIQGRESLVAGRPVVDVVAQLGYPVYVLKILGALKVAGAAVLFAPGVPRLKEWAYAGVTFELTGAAASHTLRGNGPGEVIGCLILATFALVSWALRPPSRTLGVIVVDNARPLRPFVNGSDLQPSARRADLVSPAGARLAVYYGAATR